MKILFLKNGETIGIGEHTEGSEREVPDDVAGVLINRGVALEAVPVEINEISGGEEREDGGE